ncbi:hypothetical protein BVRB_3g060290 [Beta vulgaris subsp. vulgaris]|nr:hypothetical protein BVRB_3g060290 [Beta vulgaris subsp. vulgaris]
MEFGNKAYERAKDAEIKVTLLENDLKQLYEEIKYYKYQCEMLSWRDRHCSKGQKMIVKVLDVENSSDDDQQSGNETAAEDTKKKSDATQALGHLSLPSFMVLFIIGHHIMGRLLN